MTPKQQRALQIRDASLRLIKRHGEVKQLPNVNTSHLSVRTDQYFLMLNTPEHPRPGLPDHIRAIGAARGLEVTELPYSLDIWIQGINKPGQMGKVLSISWDGDRFVLTSFKRGPWEETILSAAPAQ